MTLAGFDPVWRDFPDYILGVTRQIWEGRDVDSLNHYYAADIPVRSPMGLVRGNQAVIAATHATLQEFPDRELFGQDVIWHRHASGYLSSHRILSTGTHQGDGAFGEATGRGFQIYVLADCAARDNTIFDEWLVRDFGGLVRQLGHDPAEFARATIRQEGGAGDCVRPFTPAIDVAGGYTGTGNDNPWGIRYADILQRIMAGDAEVITRCYDRAVIGEYAGARQALSWQPVGAVWQALRSAFPDAGFAIHHRIGMDAELLPARAALRWSLHGKHTGDGLFGPATGAEVHVMGISHAEFGPYGEQAPTVRREWALWDEVAIWKQILMYTEAD